MKKIYLYIGLLLFTFAYGCGDFLEESSQDEIRPSTVEDLEQILQGDAYYNPNSTASGGGANFFSITDIFTDNLQCYGVASNATQNLYESRDAKFLWRDNMFTDEGDGEDAAYWKDPYRGIGACNVILDFIGEMTGDEVEREHIRGEALVLRAYYYLHLVNFFGMPYNNGDPSTNLAVPLQLTSDVVSEGPSRNTVQEVYEQIEGDMLRGYQLMKENPKVKDYFRIGPEAAAAMLTRVYLYMENWDKTIAYADSVLSTRQALLDLNTLELPDFQATSRARLSVMSEDYPTEILWVRPYAKNFYQDQLGVNKMPWAVSDDLSELMLGGVTPMAAVMQPELVHDLRGLFYFAWANASGYYMLCPDKPYSDLYNYGKTQGLRLAEVYLNKIEACINKFIETGDDSYRIQALEDLNYLRQHRYRTDSEEWQPLDIQDGEELMTIYKHERRKELVGENNHRWFDIRRFGETFTHIAFAKEGEEVEATLRTSQYALPIPQDALNQNGNLKQNVRN